MSKLSGIKRKKKRSFLQQQKRFGKQGRYGCGTQLAEDTYQYFIRIMEVMKSVNEDPGEMEILACNVFAELCGKEVDYSFNQLASRVMEQLLPYTSDEQFCNFVKAFSENLRPIFSDPYSSHVLEQVIVFSFARYAKHFSEEDSKLKIRYFDFIMKITKFSLNNIEDFAWDKYGNHIIRTILNGLSGHPTKGEIDLKQFSLSLVDDFHDLLNEFVTRILAWPQFSDLPNQEITSALLQTLLITTKEHHEMSEQLVRKIIKESKNIDIMVEDNQPQLRLIETALIVANKKHFRKIYKKFFKGNIMKLSVSKSGNFAVQKLLANCADKELFIEILTPLIEQIEDILLCGNTGVLLAMAQGCHNLKTNQGDFLMALMKVLRCYEPEERNIQIAPLLCSLTVYDKYDVKYSKINLHGSLILQELLHFNKPIKLVNSLLAMSEAGLVQLLCDPRGCHVTDAYVRSTFVGEKSRERLFKKLQGHYLSLATSKHGSRSLDAIWDVIQLKHKLILMEELRLKQSELTGNQYGMGFAKRTHLDNFRRNKDSWTTQLKMTSNTKKFFADIIPKKMKLDKKS